MRASFEYRSTAPPPPHTSGIDLDEVTRVEADELEREDDPPVRRVTVTYRSGCVRRLYGQDAGQLLAAVREQREAEQRWTLTTPVPVSGAG